MGGGRALLVRVWPRTLAGQLTLALTGVLLVAQVLNVFLLMGERRIVGRAAHMQAAVARFVVLAESTPTPRRVGPPRTVFEGGRVIGVAFFSRANQAASEDAYQRRPDYERRLRRGLTAAGLTPSTVTVSAGRWAEKAGERPGGAPRFGPGGPRPPPHSRRSPDPQGAPAPGMEEIILSAELAPGVWLNALAPHYAAEALTWRAALGAIAMIGMATLAIAVLVRRLMRPLSALAAAAEQFGRGAQPERVEETGPQDVLRAAQSFNRMQDRIARLVETQRGMLRAVGHDLRTPLTSLRLRAENLPNAPEREKMIETLDDMSVMTEEILCWAKDTASLEPLAAVDLTALIASLADDYAERGAPVSFQDAPATIIRCRRVALRRALGNLIDNALAYGGQARVALAATSEHVVVTVDDDGPGIPDDRHEEILRPFVRMEGSRSRDTGGAGLGLSIVHSIIEGHGGRLSLQNRAEGGLRARIALPASDETRARTSRAAG